LEVNLGVTLLLNEMKVGIRICSPRLQIVIPSYGTALIISVCPRPETRDKSLTNRQDEGLVWMCGEITAKNVDMDRSDDSKKVRVIANSGKGLMIAKFVSGRLWQQIHVFHGDGNVVVLFFLHTETHHPI